MGPSDSAIKGAALALGENMMKVSTQYQYVRFYLSIAKARDCFACKSYFLMFKDPQITVQKKQNLIKQLLQKMKQGKHFNYFCLVLLKMNLLHLMPEIINLFLMDGLIHIGAEIGVLFSARKFSKDELQQVEQALRQKWNLVKLKLYYFKDPKISTGFIIKTGQKTVDYTINNKLNKMRKQILNQ